MQKTITWFITSFAIAPALQATVSIELQFGTLRASTGDVVSNGTLWALFYQSATATLPGGLVQDSSLVDTIDQKSSIASDFTRGSTIAEGQTIGGSKILLTGVVGDNGIVVDTSLTAVDLTTLGVATDGIYGFFWFPGLTATNNDIPLSGAFEVGGFNELTASANSGGNQGMKFPADGASVITAYFDEVITEGGTDFSTARFTAVAIPEPSAIVLTLLGSAALLRRRRA